MSPKKLTAMALLFALACLGGCGNDDDDAPHIPSATYTIGGELSGLESGASVTLQNNGADDLTLTQNGSFTFPAAIADGTAYNVTVLTSPAEHGCTVTNGTGRVHAADVSDIAIVCSLTPRGQFSMAPSLSVARIGHTATLLPGGKVLVVGGYEAAAASAEVYDPAANAWSPVANLLTPRGYHSATLLESGRVLVAGGGNDGIGGFYTASAELYDPVANTWSPTANMARTHGTHTATLLPNGKVLLVGGNGNGTAYPELYDPATNAWSPAGSPAAARVSHTATLLAGGKVLVAGGWYGGPLASAELYDPDTNTWSAAGNLPVAHYDHTATLLASGKVIVAGGWYNMTVTANAALYDPGTNAWTVAPSMATGLVGHAATLLASGKVLVVGGAAELYDPETNAWSLTGTPLVGRMNQTLTVLPSTKVLVVGGYGFDAAAEEARVELYW